MREFCLQLVSCMRLRWSSDARALTKPARLVPLALMLVVAHALAGFAGSLTSAAPPAWWVLVIAALGGLLGRSLPGWQPLDRGGLMRLGCSPGRSWGLATLSLVVTVPNVLLLWPLDELFTAAGAPVPLLLAVVADVVAVACLQLAAPVGGRRVRMPGLPRLWGRSRASETVAWGLIRLCGQRGFWLAVAQALCGEAGAFLVLRLLRCPPSTVALGCAALWGVMVGLVPQNAVAMEGAGLWMDLIYVPTIPWSRVGAAVPSVILGGLGIVACCLLNTPSAGETTAAGILWLGWSLGIAQVWSVLLPYRLHRVRPRHRTAAPLSRVYLTQFLLLAAVAGPLMLIQTRLWVLRNPVRIGGGIVAGIGGTMIAGIVLEARGRTVLAYLKGGNGGTRRDPRSSGPGRLMRRQEMGRQEKE